MDEIIRNPIAREDREEITRLDRRIAPRREDRALALDGDDERIRSDQLRLVRFP